MSGRVGPGTSPVSSVLAAHTALIPASPTDVVRVDAPLQPRNQDPPSAEALSRFRIPHDVRGPITEDGHTRLPARVPLRSPGPRAAAAAAARPSVGDRMRFVREPDAGRSACPVRGAGLETGADQGLSAPVLDSTWRSLRDSNPCYSLERAMSWASRRRERGQGLGKSAVL